MITDYFSRERVGYQTHVSRTGSDRKPGNVSYPHLLRPGDDDLLRAGFQQIRVSVKTMMTVRCFMISPGRTHQQTGLPEDGKQAVTSDMQRGVGPPVEDVVQLARAQPRLLHPEGLHLLSNAAGLLCLTLLPLTPLIPGLTAYL